jgi:hypothetical protein
MEKSELQDLVQECFVLFNQTLYEKDRKVILKAWWALLQDLPYEEARQELIRYSMQEQWMPTPGALRRRWVQGTMNGAAPSPHQFWGYIQAVIKARNAGTTINIKKEIAEHPAVTQTIEDLGADVAWNLTTNGDRTWVLEAYTENVKQFMAKCLTVVESNA